MRVDTCPKSSSAKKEHRISAVFVVEPTRNYPLSRKRLYGYLKPFELAVKIGDANGLMASHTRTGGMKSSGTYAMLTAVVRDE